MIDLDAIRKRAAIDAVTGAFSDRRALLAEVDRLRAQNAKLWEACDSWGVIPAIPPGEREPPQD